MNVFSGDFLKSEADIIVIPHSTEGLLDDQSRAWLLHHDLEGYIPVNVQLGYVQYLQLSDKSRPKYIVFTCTIQNQNSSYSALRQIAYDLVRLWPNASCKKIALPILGGSGRNIQPLQCYQVLRMAFEEVQVSGYEVFIFTQDKDLYERLSLMPIKREKSSAAIVFDLLVEGIKSAKWVTELTISDEYYFKLALDKFNEYLNFEAPLVFFRELLDRFQREKTTFSKFFQQLSSKEKDTQFLLICGQLTAYIDKHAYLKKDWNRYEDRRTIASSSVNQTRWIEGLLRYRINENGFKDIPPSIANAISYLLAPESSLTMLSITHRTLCFRVLLGKHYNIELMPILFELFRDSNFECKNPMNKGYLISRILYSPEIKP